LSSTFNVGEQCLNRNEAPFDPVWNRLTACIFCDLVPCSVCSE
jgi:hypothetical protein